MTETQPLRAENLLQDRFTRSASGVSGLCHPNVYVGKMLDEFSDWAYDGEIAAKFRGRWRDLGFGLADATGIRVPMDLEIGPGNGNHFAHRAVTCPERLLVGVELKFKPLVQSIRRAVRAGCMNARIARFDADDIRRLFAPGEIDDVFIHFPDPWPKKRNWKNRLIDEAFLGDLHRLQTPGSVVDFKTDSEAYFDWAMEHIPKSPYKLAWSTRDLHRSEHAGFVTHFESLFVGQGLPIFSARLVREN